jgi:hypothetical protein
MSTKIQLQEDSYKIVGCPSFKELLSQSQLFGGRQILTFTIIFKGKKVRVGITISCVGQARCNKPGNPLIEPDDGIVSFIGWRDNECPLEDRQRLWSTRVASYRYKDIFVGQVRTSGGPREGELRCILEENLPDDSPLRDILYIRS